MKRRKVSGAAVEKVTPFDDIRPQKSKGYKSMDLMDLKNRFKQNIGRMNKMMIKRMVHDSMNSMQGRSCRCFKHVVYFRAVFMNMFTFDWCVFSDGLHESTITDQNMRCFFVQSGSTHPSVFAAALV